MVLAVEFLYVIRTVVKTTYFLDLLGFCALKRFFTAMSFLCNGKQVPVLCM